SNRTNVKKRRNYEEPSLNNSDESSLRSIETNNSVENHELQATNVNVISNKGKKSSNHIKAKGRIEIESSLIDKQASNASFSFSLIKNTLSYKQQSFASKVSPSFSVRSDSSENTNNQYPSISNNTDISSTSLIGPFKNNLEICLYLVQHSNLIKLIFNMIEAGSQGSTGIQEKADKFNVLPKRIVNNEDYSDQNLQENFSEESQHVNSNFECSFSMASDMLSSKLNTLNSISDTDTLSSTSDSLSSCNQSTIIEEIELQSEVRTESTQTIVDSGIDF
ncbi:9058_t:CDS:2, partial [Cetraspora pellucida]